MHDIKFSLSQHLIVKKIWRIFSNYLSNFQNLPKIMKPSLVPRGPRHQGFCDPGLHRAIKKLKSDFAAEYPIWMYIKRYLTGKLALACQNEIYCIRLKENVQKPSKIAEF